MSEQQISESDSLKFADREARIAEEARREQQRSADKALQAKRE